MQMDLAGPGELDIKVTSTYSTTLSNKILSDLG